jgi:mRNA interferase RelE/StbE
VYRLEIRQSAERDLLRLPQPLFVRLNRQILALREDPRPSGAKKLKGRLEGWRVRVGQYRILYQIDDQNQTVTIARVRHRRDVYR